MAKKEKVELTESQKEDRELIKKYGDIISSGARIFEKMSHLKTLSISPALDLALGGGLREGTWVLVSGDPKQGKTSTCLQIAANAQKEGRNVIYIDGEGRLKSHNLSGIMGLNLEKIQVIHSPENGTLSAEKFLDVAESLIKRPENIGAVCILDSCSSLIPEAEMAKETSGQIRNSLPRVLSHFTKKMNQVIPHQKTIFVIITHYISNTSGFGKVKIPDCGVKIQYQADTRLDIKFSKDWEENGNIIGKEINWTISTSALGSHSPTAISYFRYNEGLDSVQELLFMGDAYGVIDKAGAWYTLSFLEDHLEAIGDKEWNEKKYKFQGQAKLRDFLVNNEVVLEILKKEIRELIG